VFCDVTHTVRYFVSTVMLLYGLVNRYVLIQRSFSKIGLDVYFYILTKNFTHFQTILTIWCSSLFSEVKDRPAYVLSILKSVKESL